MRSLGAVSTCLAGTTWLWLYWVGHHVVMR
jgi:hypothetical protein